MSTTGSPSVYESDMEDENDEYDPLFHQLKATLHGYSCEHCGTNHATISCHGNCGQAYYCSKECLVFHSSIHRRHCLTHRQSLISDSSNFTMDLDLEEEDDDLPVELTLAIDTILLQIQEETRQR